MKIRYEIKPKKDRKVVYNAGEFSIELLRSVFSSLYIQDPARTVKIVYENKV